MHPKEQEEETKESLNYFRGELRLYIKGTKKALDIFNSKAEMKQIMEDWQLEYRFVDGLEIGVIFD